jgi:hypothetical protein
MIRERMAWELVGNVRGVIGGDGWVDVVGKERTWVVEIEDGEVVWRAVGGRTDGPVVGVGVDFAVGMEEGGFGVEELGEGGGGVTAEAEDVGETEVGVLDVGQAFESPRGVEVVVSRTDAERGVGLEVDAEGGTEGVEGVVETFDLGDDGEWVDGVDGLVARGLAEVEHELFSLM